MPASSSSKTPESNTKGWRMDGKSKPSRSKPAPAAAASSTNYDMTNRTMISLEEQSRRETESQPRSSIASTPEKQEKKVKHPKGTTTVKPKKKPAPAVQHGVSAQQITKTISMSDQLAMDSAKQTSKGGKATSKPKTSKSATKLAPPTKSSKLSDAGSDKSKDKKKKKKKKGGKTVAEAALDNTVGFWNVVVQNVEETKEKIDKGFSRKSITSDTDSPASPSSPVPVSARTKEAREALAADFDAWADPHAQGTHIHRRPKVDDKAAKTSYAPMNQLDVAGYGPNSSVPTPAGTPGFLQTTAEEVKPHAQAAAWGTAAASSESANVLSPLEMMQQFDEAEKLLDEPEEPQKEWYEQDEEPSAPIKRPSLEVLPPPPPPVKPKSPKKDVMLEPVQEEQEQEEDEAVKAEYEATLKAQKDIEKKKKKRMEDAVAEQPKPEEPVTPKAKLPPGLAAKVPKPEEHATPTDDKPAKSKKKKEENATLKDDMMLAFGMDGADGGRSSGSSATQEPFNARDQAAVSKAEPSQAEWAKAMAKTPSKSQSQDVVSSKNEPADWEQPARKEPKNGSQKVKKQEAASKADTPPKPSTGPADWEQPNKKSTKLEREDEPADWEQPNKSSMKLDREDEAVTADYEATLKAQKDIEKKKKKREREERERQRQIEEEEHAIAEQDRQERMAEAKFKAAEDKARKEKEEKDWFNKAKQNSVDLYNSDKRNSASYHPSLNNSASALSPRTPDVPKRKNKPAIDNRSLDQVWATKPEDVQKNAKWRAPGSEDVIAGLGAVGESFASGVGNSLGFTAAPQKKRFITIYKGETDPLGIMFKNDGLVLKIAPNTAADRSELKPGHYIVAINGVHLNSLPTEGRDKHFAAMVKKSPAAVEILYKDSKVGDPAVQDVFKDPSLRTKSLTQAVEKAEADLVKRRSVEQSEAQKRAAAAVAHEAQVKERERRWAQKIAEEAEEQGSSPDGSPGGRNAYAMDQNRLLSPGGTGYSKGLDLISMCEKHEGWQEKALAKVADEDKFEKQQRKELKLRERRRYEDQIRKSNAVLERSRSNSPERAQASAAATKNLIRKSLTFQQANPSKHTQKHHRKFHQMRSEIQEHMDGLSSEPTPDERPPDPAEVDEMHEKGFFFDDKEDLQEELDLEEIPSDPLPSNEGSSDYPSIGQNYPSIASDSHGNRYGAHSPSPLFGEVIEQEAARRSPKAASSSSSPTPPATSADERDDKDNTKNEKKDDRDDKPPPDESPKKSDGGNEGQTEPPPTYKKPKKALYGNKKKLKKGGSSSKKETVVETSAAAARPEKPDDESERLIDRTDEQQEEEDDDQDDGDEEDASRSFDKIALRAASKAQKAASKSTQEEDGDDKDEGEQQADPSWQSPQLAWWNDDDDDDDPTQGLLEAFGAGAAKPKSEKSDRLSKSSSGGEHWDPNQDAGSGDEEGDDKKSKDGQQPQPKSIQQAKVPTKKKQEGVSTMNRDMLAAFGMAGVESRSSKSSIVLIGSKEAEEHAQKPKSPARTMQNKSALMGAFGFSHDAHDHLMEDGTSVQPEASGGSAKTNKSASNASVPVSAGSQRSQRPLRRLSDRAKSSARGSDVVASDKDHILKNSDIEGSDRAKRPFRKLSDRAKSSLRGSGSVVSDKDGVVKNSDNEQTDKRLLEDNEQTEQSGSFSPQHRGLIGAFGYSSLNHADLVKVEKHSLGEHLAKHSVSSQDVPDEAKPGEAIATQSPTDNDSPGTMRKVPSMARSIAERAAAASVETEKVMQNRSFKDKSSTAGSRLFKSGSRLSQAASSVGELTVEVSPVSHQHFLSPSNSPGDHLQDISPSISPDSRRDDIGMRSSVSGLTLEAVNSPMSPDIDKTPSVQQDQRSVSNRSDASASAEQRQSKISSSKKKFMNARSVSGITVMSNLSGQGSEKPAGLPVGGYAGFLGGGGGAAANVAISPVNRADSDSNSDGAMSRDSSPGRDTSSKFSPRVDLPPDVKPDSVPSLNMSGLNGSCRQVSKSELTLPMSPHMHDLEDEDDLPNTPDSLDAPPRKLSDDDDEDRDASDDDDAKKKDAKTKKGSAKSAKQSVKSAAGQEDDEGGWWTGLFGSPSSSKKDLEKQKDKSKKEKSKKEKHASSEDGQDELEELQNVAKSILHASTKLDDDAIESHRSSARSGSAGVFGALDVAFESLEKAIPQTKKKAPIDAQAVRNKLKGVVKDIDRRVDHRTHFLFSNQNFDFHD